MSRLLEHIVKICLDSYSSRIFEIIMSGLLWFTCMTIDMGFPRESRGTSKMFEGSPVPAGMEKCGNISITSSSVAPEPRLDSDLARAFG